ncbi:pilus assembly protein [Butyrivibrio sp. AE3004]|uniref:pilus assembly protein n=1 Tax=Butyrivibrio sp. AE3004 TaxID=1506994 RepID=UPI000691430C|nr:pilus assembly protein [Butyrivibrio sp. AE3004]
MKNNNIKGKKMDYRLKEFIVFVNIKDMLLRVNRKRLSLAASVTVEAAIVLPIFLFFFVNLLALFDILKFQCDLECALHQTGRQIMADEVTLEIIAGKSTKEMMGGKVAGVVDAAYASKKVKTYLGEEYLEHSPISGGSSGLKFLETALYSGGDIIDIVAAYKVHPLFKIAAFTDFSQEGRFYGHAFTGYSINGDGWEDEAETEELVYITETGTVFHRSLNCTHLKLSVKKIAKSEVSAKRNLDGAKFYPCESCGKLAGKTVYITNYGNRYHSERTCKNIKRTIKTVKISEVGGKSACKECAG